MWENSGIYADLRDSKVSANTIISRLRVMDLSARDQTLSKLCHLHFEKELL